MVQPKVRPVTTEPCQHSTLSGKLTDVWLLMLGCGIDDLCLGVFETEQHAIDAGAGLDADDCEEIADEIGEAAGLDVTVIINLYVCQPGASKRTIISTFEDDSDMDDFEEST